MKTILLILILSFTQDARSQNFDEWVRQKRTQIRYLVQQVGELQVHLEMLKKGYDIVREGINTVEEITKGEFDLHNNYFTSLMKVNPHVLRYTNFPELIFGQNIINKRVTGIKYNLYASPDLSEAESAFIIKILDNLQDAATRIYSNLEDVLLNNKLQMTDHERLRRIDELKEEYKKHIVDLDQVELNIQQMIANRIAESNEIRLLRKLNNLQP